MAELSPLSNQELIDLLLYQQKTVAFSMHVRSSLFQIQCPHNLPRNEKQPRARQIYKGRQSKLDALVTILYMREKQISQVNPHALLFPL
jgi:hypothetical protein